jgi:hypothetical protein
VKAIENENNNIGNIELYPGTIYNSTIVSEPTIFKSDHSYFIQNDINFTSSVEFQPRTQIFINPACMVKFYGAVTTPEFTSPKDMWKITSGKEIYSTSPVIMDVDSYYSAVNFYGDEINLRSGFVRYGSNAFITINVPNNNFFYMVFRDCGTALTTNQGNLDAEYMTISDCNTIGILYTTEEEAIYNVSITRIIFNNNAQKAVAIQKAGMLNINNCYFNNNYYAINLTKCNNNIEYNEFNLNYYNIFCYKNYYPNEIHYNKFYKTNLGIHSSGSINNINNNNFYKTTKYFINIIYSISPYSLVSADVNATNNYWAVEEINQYLGDAEDDPRCPYHIIYLPKLSKPVSNAGIQ